jgi:DNA-binding response OmpR family regulator
VVRSRTQDADRVALLTAGADDDLPAPFSALQLSVKARNLLSLPRAAAVRS